MRSNQPSNFRGSLKILLMVLLLKRFLKLLKLLQLFKFFKSFQFYLIEVRLAFLFHLFYSALLYQISFTSSFSFFFMGKEMVSKEHVIPPSKRVDECGNRAASLNMVSVNYCNGVNFLFQICREYMK